MNPATRTRQIAWTPLPKPSLIPLLAIRCHPMQQFNDDIYVSLLAGRVQAMVDMLEPEDRGDAVCQFQEAMFCESMVREVAFCPSDEVGVNLVMSNIDVRDKLASLGVGRRWSKLKPPLIEHLLAHQALMSDLENPIDNLTMWAWRIGRV